MRSAKPIVVGISGISGAGKTFYIEKLKEKLSNSISVLSFDDYYKPLYKQKVDYKGYPNFDLPEALNHQQFLMDLEKLIRNQSVALQKYNFENYNSPKVIEIIEPAPLLIVEGIFVFDFLNIDTLISYRIFIEADMDLCLSRRLRRDEHERGIPLERSLYQWHNHVIPAFNKHILPHKQRCDAVLINDGLADANVELILNAIQGFMK